MAQKFGRVVGYRLRSKSFTYQKAIWILIHIYQSFGLNLIVLFDRVLTQKWIEIFWKIDVRKAKYKSVRFALQK